VSVATKTDPEAIQEDIAHIEATMQTLRAAVNNQVDRGDAQDPEAVKAALADWFDAFESTIRSGHVDGGAALHVRSDSLTLCGAALVKDTAKIESGLKKLEQAAAVRWPEFGGIRWNAANYSGVRFHTLSVSVPEEHAAPRKLLGNELEIVVGIGPETVYLAVGGDGMNAIQEAMDASAAEPNKAVSPFAFSVSMVPILEVAAEQAEPGEQQKMAQGVAEVIRREAQGRDHIHAVGEVLPQGLRYRFVAEEGALRAVGAAATEAQRQALQANQ
jgi:hypothetical protein